MATSNIFADGNHLKLCLLSFVSTHCLHFLWFLTIMGLPSLLLPLLPSAGKALKPNSDLSWSFCLVLFYLQHCSQNCELHSYTSGSGNSSGSSVACDYTEVAWELCSPSFSEMPILISVRNFSWPGPLLVSQKYVGAFFLQWGIYILQSLTRHTNLFSWITGCSLANTVICQVSGKAMSVGAYTACMSLPCFQFCGIIFAPHQTTQGHSWLLAE